MRRICIVLCLAGLIVGMNACGRTEKTVDEKAAETYVNGQESEREGLQESEITGGTDNEEVQFECKVIEDAVREQLNKGPDAVISRQTLEKIEELTIWFKNEDEPACIADDLRYFTNLKVLDIFVYECMEEKILDYAELGAGGALNNLEELYISDYYFENISFVTKLDSLKQLYITEANIRDISVLREMKQLTHLVLNNTSIQDTEPIGELTNLVYLSLKNCGIEDISFLKDMKSLNCLSLSGNKIKDISLLAQFTQLTRLELDRNEITDVSALISMENLVSVSIYDNPVKNLGLLVGIVPDFDISAGKGKRENTWNDEMEKALQIYDVTTVEIEGHLLKIEDYYVGDATGDGIDDVGIVASWTSEGVFDDIKERMVYVYPGTGSSYREPLILKPEENLGSDDTYDGIILQDGRLIIQYHSDGAYSDRWTYVYKIENQAWERVMEISLGRQLGTTAYVYWIYDRENDIMNKYVLCMDELNQWYKLKVFEREKGIMPMDIRTPDATVADYDMYLYHHEMEELPYSAQDALEMIVLEIIANEFGCEYKKERVYITNRDILDSCEKLYGFEVPDYYYAMDTPYGIAEIYYYDYERITERNPEETEKHVIRVCLNGGLYEVYTVEVQSGKIELTYAYVKG